MTTSQFTNHLGIIKAKLLAFSKIADKYPLGHVYYKNNIKDLQLLMRGELLKIRALKLDKASEMDSTLVSFLSMNRLTSRNCADLIEKINYTLQDIEIDSETKNLFTERIYEKGSPFDFHLDIREIIKKATNGIFIIEPYIDEDLLEITLRGINPKIALRVLSNSNNPRGNFVKVSNKFALQHKASFETRGSLDIHDRAIFIDGKDGWVMGQSINSAAKNKPAYLIKLRDSQKLESIYQKIWNFAKKIK